MIMCLLIAWNKMIFMQGCSAALICVCLVPHLFHLANATTSGLSLITADDNLQQYNHSYPGCWLGDQFYMAGDRWSPVMEPFGRMVCVKCQCAQVVKNTEVQLEGRVVCRNIKYDCPRTRCDSPVLREGTCCKICPDNTRPYFEDQFLPPSDIPHAGTPLLHDGTEMTALLVGRSKLRKGSKKTRSVAVMHVTNIQQDTFQYAIRYQRLRKPTGVIIADEYGTEMLRKSITAQKSRTGSIHGFWSNVPKPYMQYIKRGGAYVMIVTSRRKAGEIAGKLLYTNMATKGHFEALLSPPINTGTGAFVTLVYDVKTSIATYSVDIGGVKLSKSEQPDFFVTFERDTTIIHQHLLTASSLRKQLIGKLQADSTLSKQLARGRMQVRVTSRRGETMIGFLRPRTIRKNLLTVFQGVGVMANVTGFIVLSLLDTGAMKFKVSVSGMYGRLSELTLQLWCERRNSWRTVMSLQGASRRVDIGKVVATGVHKKLRARDSVALLDGLLRLKLRAYGHPVVSEALTRIPEQSVDLFTESYQVLTGHGCPGTTAYVWYSLTDKCSLTYYVGMTVPDGSARDLEVSFSNIRQHSKRHAIGLGSSGEIANFTELIGGISSRSLPVQISLYFNQMPCEKLVNKINIENTCKVRYPSSNSAEPDPGQSPTAMYRCYYEGEFYSHGDSWVPEEGACVTCRCDRGNVHCDDVICPRPSCPYPIRRPSECCRVCEEENETEKKHLGRCYFHGDKRWHPVGVEWHPYIPPFGYSKCALCRCLPGSLEVNCTRLPCPRLDCPPSRRARLHQDDCCQVCDESPSLRIPNTINLLDVKRKDCVFSGRLYKHGQSWHPALKPFGEMKCYTCVCKRGDTKCRKQKCPKLRCRHTYKPTDQCCTVCLDQRSRYSSEELFRSMAGA